jgi:uncharacterized protein (TIRG00374 family)
MAGLLNCEELQTARRQSAAWWILALSIAGALLFLSLRGVEWRRIWEIIAHARLDYLGASVLCACVGLVFRCLRWRLVLNAAGRVGVGLVFWAMSAGYMGNNFLPARAGEVVRSVMVSSCSGLSSAYTLTTALTERVMDALALVLIGAVALLSLGTAPKWILELARTLAFVSAAGALVLVLLPKVEDRIRGALWRLLGSVRWRDRAFAVADQCFLGLRAFHDAGRFFRFTAFTAVIWTLDSFGVMLLARALSMNVGLPLAMLLLAALGLGSGLPSTPGYIGIYQFVAVTVLMPFGFRRDDALAYILLAQFLAYILVTVCGSIGLAKYRKLRAVAQCAGARVTAGQQRL